MKRFFLISSVILSMIILEQNVFGTSLHTIKIHRYELLYSDFYSIKINLPTKSETSFYKIVNKKNKIKLKANKNLGVETLFTPFLNYRNVGFIFAVLNGYILDINKKLLEIKARENMKKRQTIDVKVDVDESRERIIASPYQSSSFTQIKISPKNLITKLKKFWLWLEDILNHYQVRILNISNLNDGVIDDENLKKIVDLKTRTDGLLSHKSQFINFKPNLEKAYDEVKKQIKIYWNEFVLNHKLHIAVFFNMSPNDIQNKLLFEEYIKPKKLLENLNDNSDKYVRKLNKKI